MILLGGKQRTPSKEQSFFLGNCVPIVLGLFNASSIKSCCTLICFNNSVTVLFYYI